MQQLDTISLNAAISSAAKGKHWEKAMSYLEVMQRSGLSPDVITYNAAISACDKSQQWQRALSLVDELRQVSFLPDVMTCSAAIRVLGRGKQWERALRLLTVMRQLHVLPDVMVCSAAISACEKSKRWEQALDLLANMQLLELLLDVIACNAAISACEKGEQWERSLALLAAMQKTKLLPSVVTCNAVISACGTCEHWHRALDLMLRMRQFHLLPNLITMNAALGACSKGKQWQEALGLLTEMLQSASKPNVITYTAAISACEKCQRWEEALDLLKMMLTSDLLPDVINYSSAISACEKAARWQAAVSLLCLMPSKRVKPNEITYNATLSACDQNAEWKQAVRLLSLMSGAGLLHDVVAYNVIANVCEKAGHWRTSSNLLSQMSAASVDPDEITTNVAIRTLANAECWELALKLQSPALHANAIPTEASYIAAISACARTGQVEQGLNLLWEAETNGVGSSASFLLWSFASLLVIDVATIQAASVEAVQRLHTSKWSPPELAALCWAFATLGSSYSTVLPCLTQQVVSQLPDFDIADLLLVAWGAAANSQSYASVDCDISSFAFNGISSRLKALHLSAKLGLNLAILLLLQNELVERLCYPCASIGTEAKHTNDEMLGVLWASNFAECLTKLFYLAVHSSMQRHGLGLDSGKNLCRVSTTPNACSTARSLGDGDKVRVSFELPDRLVVFKPAGWEVRDEQHELQLAPFLRESYSRQLAILHDVEHDCGFLHRLDVPCSGLVLVAKTFEAYYDLRVQLCSGDITRDYAFLCHGWASRCLREVRARLHWRGRDCTLAGGQGKPSHTKLKTILHSSCRAVATSLLAARILTGRKHQIRSHSSHVGHATVCDGRYSSAVTFQSDQHLCLRNCLHRYRLAFKTTTCDTCDLLTPLPADLVDTLRQFRGVGKASSARLSDWVACDGPKDWAMLQPL